MRCDLGFDGGGTKTECVLMEPPGKILARTRSGPSNPMRVGFAAAVRALEEAANLALQHAGVAPNNVAALCAGLAGVGTPESRERMRVALMKAFPGVAVSVVTDLEIALAAADPGPAIVLVAGTGSAAIGRNSHGKIARAGGLGPAIGDEGSAYDIGRRAIAAASRTREQAGIETPLSENILRELRCLSWSEIQISVEKAADEVYPLVFPVVAKAADAKNPVACDLLRHAAGELASLVTAVAEQLDLSGAPFLLAKTGGTIGRSRFFDAEIDAAVQQALPLAKIGPLRMPPAEAAARAARA